MKTKKIKITHFSDSGHSWLAVKRDVLKALGIMEKISACSYQNGKTVYLEEDCDAPIFLRAFFGEKLNPDFSNIRELEAQFFEVKNSYKDGASPIRNYARFTSREPMVLFNEALFQLYGNKYRALYPCDAGAWVVQSLANGQQFRMKKNQVAACYPIEE